MKLFVQLLFIFFLKNFSKVLRKKPSKIRKVALIFFDEKNLEIFFLSKAQEDVGSHCGISAFKEKVFGFFY